MLKLTWNTAKLGNLKCGAKSSTNTEAVVDFSPLLKNMSKHGHCAATVINIYIFNIVYCYIYGTQKMWQRYLLLFILETMYFY